MAADKRDEIIAMQLDLIRQMTQNNIKRLSDDIWGTAKTARTAEKADPSAGLHIKASIPKISTFGNGNETTVKFDEYKGPEASKALYEQIIPGLVIVLFYEFDYWFDYILPEIEISDFGFIGLNYEKYGVSQ